MRKAHTIVKVGGAQGSHGVRTSDGKSFAFSQFGCGTFEGVQTYISKRFVVDPIALMSEAEELEKVGVVNPMSLVTVSADALCSTVFHMAASMLSELLLKDKPRGTIGSGVGQAVRLDQARPELSIRAGDLQLPNLRDKLIGIQRHYQETFAEALSDLDRFNMIDLDYVAEVQLILKNEDVVNATYQMLQEFVWCKRIVSDDYLANVVLAKQGVVVSESSHGVLTDNYVGFHPHTSALRTLPRFTRAMYNDAGYDGEIVSLGVHRAYNIRHGAGPLPTHSESMSESLLPGSNKLENRWQGKVRVGPLDLVLLRYALAASGEGAYDGLAITWFDQVAQNGEWDICDSYAYTPGRSDWYETPVLESIAKDCGLGGNVNQIAHLLQSTRKVHANCTSIPLPSGADRDQLYDLVAKKLLDHLGVPVRMISFGPTEQDKVCK